MEFFLKVLSAQFLNIEYRRCRKFLLYFVTVERHVWHLGLGIENFATRNELDHVVKDQVKVIALVYTAS